MHSLTSLKEMHTHELRTQLRGMSIVGQDKEGGTQTPM